MKKADYRTFKNPTFFLSISKKGLRCSEVAEFMNKMYVPCSVTGNYSVQCSRSDELLSPSAIGQPRIELGTRSDTKKKCHIERGCRIIFQEDENNKVDDIWKKLKEEFDLTCAHLETRAHFGGCVYDYLKPSACPSSTWSP